jgi:hypothetical protein
VAKKEPLCVINIKNETESMLTFANHIFPSGRGGTAKIYFVGQIAILAGLVERGKVSLIEEVSETLFKLAGVAVPIPPSKTEVTEIVEVTNPEATNPEVTNPEATNPEATNPEATTAASDEAINPEATAEVTTEVTAEVTTEAATDEVLSVVILTSEIIETYEKKVLNSIAKQLGLDVNRDTNVPTLKTMIKEFVAALSEGSYVVIDDTDPSSIIVSVQ